MLPPEATATKHATPIQRNRLIHTSTGLHLCAQPYQRPSRPEHLDLRLFIMKVLTRWLRHYLPSLTVTDRQLADDL
ncbi:MAG TPA: hypothetical protein VK608_09640, partial [Edaphobacter sp.]|nr:hypothetical protein [Edaphobacter sp.]